MDRLVVLIRRRACAVSARFGQCSWCVSWGQGSGSRDRERAESCVCGGDRVRRRHSARRPGRIYLAGQRLAQQPDIVAFIRHIRRPHAARPPSPHKRGNLPQGPLPTSRRRASARPTSAGGALRGGQHGDGRSLPRCPTNRLRASANISAIWPVRRFPPPRTAGWPQFHPQAASASSSMWRRARNA
jgi:hypothetical protein